MEGAGDATSLAIVRKLKASPRAVWHALTQPDLQKQWMAPSDDVEVFIVENDLRVGGRYHILMKTRAGVEHDVSGDYREVTVNTKLAYTWTWNNTAERESLVTLELTAAGDGTELLLKHEGFKNTKACRQHEQQWTGRLRRLARLLA